MMKKIVYLHAAMASLNLAFVPNHFANPLPVDQLVNEDFIVMYGIGAGTAKAKVTSEVYIADAGGYIYTYQISNAAVKFSWFSVALDSINVTNWGVQVTGSETQPMAWNPDDSPAASIEALFSPGLTAANNSAILWFTCANDVDPVHGTGALAKLSIGNGVYAEGNVLVPLPEPLTVIFLSGGWILLRTYKHKKEE
jgi:hypothetical protein